MGAKGGPVCDRTDIYFKNQLGEYKASASAPRMTTRFLGGKTGTCSLAASAGNEHGCPFGALAYEGSMNPGYWEPLPQVPLVRPAYRMADALHFYHSQLEPLGRAHPPFSGIESVYKSELMAKSNPGAPACTCDMCLCN